MAGPPNLQKSTAFLEIFLTSMTQLGPNPKLLFFPKQKMGNYKSRPQTSCSEELRKKISEFHVVLRKKLQNDLQMPLPNEMSEFVEACALAQTERISTFAKPDEINQIIGN